MNKKIAHFADIHVKNLSQHEEYRSVFDSVVKILKEENPNAIVICGDIAHSKTQISPEFVEITSNMLKSFADVAPTFIILGNHDLLLSNKERQDAITPIVNSLKHPNLFLLKKSGEYIFDENITFNALSLADLKNWVKPSDLSKINIALYHGAIKGAKTDLGWTMEDGDHDIEIFENHDFAFLGDIHTSNQILDTEGRVRYCGSLVQQNFGETNDKGFLLWEIKGKDDFTCRHITIENPKPYVDVVLQKDGSVPINEDIKKGSHVRVVAEHNFSLDIIRKALDIVKTLYSPESVIFSDKSTTGEFVFSGLEEYKKEDFRDTSIQEKLISKFLENFNLKEEQLKKVFEINKKYDTEIKAKDNKIRNVNYKITELTWDNLFNYGSGNKIDFTNLNGIVGIFGKNYTGKSSIIDSLVYILTNSITKKEKKNIKNVKIINNRKQSGGGTLKLKIGNKNFFIERRLEKYKKKLNNQETTEAKMQLNFEVEDSDTGVKESLNDLDVRVTDESISNHFGTIEDFSLTSMSSQLGALSYIERGSTERKEILAKFLDLDVFGEKHKLANNEMLMYKSLMKKLDEKDFDKEINSTKSDIMGTELKLRKNIEYINKLKIEKKSLEKEILLLGQKEIGNKKSYDIDKLEEEYEYKNKKLSIIKSAMLVKTEEVDKAKKSISMLEKLILSFNKEELEKEINNGEKLEKTVEKLSNNLEKEQHSLDNLVFKSKLLEKVPCGPEFSHCDFLKDAYLAKNSIELVQISIKNKKEEHKNISSELESLNLEQKKKDIDKLSATLTRREQLKSILSKNEVLLEKDKAESGFLVKEIDDLSSKIKEFKENIEIFSKINEKIKHIKDLNNKLVDVDEELGVFEEQNVKLNKLHGSLEEKLLNLENSKAENEKIKQEYEAYDLFLKCMHSNGISYSIIKNSLGVINKEISKILTNIVNFTVFFENEENKLEIYIKRNNESENLPIELGSGAEKAIAAIAIRLAFINVSSLPKSDVFILDEPGTSLDSDNLDGFVRVLNVIKSHFKCVILITHLFALQDVADTVICIDQIDGNAYVNI